jgi:hypothetical protein
MRAEKKGILFEPLVRMRRSTALVLASIGMLVLLLNAPSVVHSSYADPKAVQIEMRNVRLHLDPAVVLEVEHLRGSMISTSGGPPVFDDQSSYVMNIASGTVAMDMASVSSLMNRYAFAYDGAPLKNVKARTEGQQVKLSGTLRKGIGIPFSSKATVGVTADGRLRLHVESLKAAGVPAKGLLGFFGLELDDLVNLKERRGVDVQENDILISPEQVLPPPRMHGRVVKAALRGDRLVQTLGGATSRSTALAKPLPSARNYIYFGGGDIRFGKLTMHDADLQLIDSDPRDPFDFYPAKYNAQLVAGYSKNTPQHGLKTFMPDFDDLSKKKKPPPPRP